jgi:hypothetical protein
MKSDWRETVAFLVCCLVPLVAVVGLAILPISCAYRNVFPERQSQSSDSAKIDAIYKTVVGDKR